jgi:predicted short-subunit dehydrogenase-like oxidoreductase (DUF2520 family)
LRAAGYEVHGPLGRDEDAGARDPDAVLLCVPDGEIAAAAGAVAAGPMVGHCSGATTLEVLGEHEAFSLHPLMTVPADGASFAGAGAAVAGSTPRALQAARELATAIGMRPFAVRDEDRAAYHAAASIASNFLITLEAAAETVARSAGVKRDVLVPLVRQTVENWARLGPEGALTGPVARGDEATISRQRAAIEERAPELVSLFDELVTATRHLAGQAVAA